MKIILSERQIKNLSENLTSDDDWRRFVDTQYDETTDYNLRPDFIPSFEIKYDNKHEFPMLIKEKDGLEYREWLYGGIGVFDGEKQIAYADNKVITVASEYQKRGIGLELVILLKERNPEHRFGSMTPLGRELMRSYYDKVIKKSKVDKPNYGMGA